ncbi:MAG: hypothetical protein ABR573_00610 [Candidatus Dormibacteria bacterium]
MRTPLLAAAAAVVLLAACGEEPAAVPTPAPSATAEAAGPLLPAPGAPGVPADTGPAGQALAAAARKTSESGSFRVKLSAGFAGTQAGPRGAMEGAGEAESHTRFHLALAFTSGTQQFSTESVSYDGVNYGRSNTQPWHVVSGAGGSSDPRSYLGYLSGATGVRDTGPGLQGGLPAERYEATVAIKRKPAAVPSAGSTAQMVAWVDAAGGRLVAEDIITAPGTPRETRLSITFTDFGEAIKVVPPLQTP